MVGILQDCRHIFFSAVIIPGFLRDSDNKWREFPTPGIKYTRPERRRPMKKGMIFTTILLFLTFGISSVTLYSQQTAQQTGTEQPPATDRPTDEGREPLPAAFRGLRLGMEIEAVKENLKEDGYFHYRGEPDVTLLPRPNYSVIECEGASFIKRGFFQFHEKKLFIIILLLNNEKIGYYSLYTTLREKYGEPDYLDPEQMVWENEEVRMSLERPLQVKYIDRDVFETLKKEGEAEESMERVMRDRFLNEF